MRTLAPIALTCLLASDATVALGYAPPPPRDYQPSLDLDGRTPVTTAARSAFAPGARIAAIGDGALAIDADSGQLVLVDHDGGRVAALDIGVGAGLVVVDPKASRAYVADRLHDRVLSIDVHYRSLTLRHVMVTPSEPYGLALAPDARTLLVTSITDRLLVAYDAETDAERWRVDVAREPRGVAIAPDGKHAIVTHLTADSVELVELASHHVETRALRHEVSSACTTHRGERSNLQCPDPDATSFARGAFAATFLGNDVAVVAFQRESPVPRPQFARASSYGGSAVPITRHVAFIGVDGTQAVAQISTAEPRALAYDADRDLLFVAGMGNDGIVAIENASSSPEWGDSFELARGDEPACGVDGLALAPGGDLLAWCAFTRSLVRVRVVRAQPNAIPRYDTTLVRGPELAPTKLSPVQHDGFVRFHHESTAIARFERAACASCHLDGRSDGLAWQIEGHQLRTPVLAGRIVGTAPYKWTGRDADLDASIMSTIDRLGGYAGTNRAEYNLKGPDPIAAYLESLPAVRAPKRAPDAIARGKALFDSAELGCSNCHSGTETTDHAHHSFEGTDLELDTPSLHGLTAAPRYLHDGSAATLDDVLREKGSIRGMIARPLSQAERDDLIAFLESL